MNYNERIKRINNLVCKGILVEKDGKLVISGKFAFMMLQEKGFRPPLTKEMIDKYIFENQIN